MDCVNHSGVPASAFCQNCGKALCSNCVRHGSGGQVLCEPCSVAWQAVPNPFVAPPMGAPNPAAWADPLGLSPSQLLAAAMAKAGSPVPAGYAAHHLIPTNVAGRSNLIQEAVKRGIYNPNGASNALRPR